ncbi:MAG: zf-HC2 domain-containing protein [Bacteroidota bacterium]
MNCRECKNLFVEAYYKELNTGDRSAFENHLAACAACASAYDKMVRTLRLMNTRTQIEPDEKFMADYWQTLKPKIAQKKEDVHTAPTDGKIIFFRPLPAWAYGIAAMIILALGVYLGRTIFTKGPYNQNQPTYSGNAEVNKNTNSAADTAIDRKVNDYLDRSRVVLLGVINSPTEEPAPTNYDRQQKISRELIQQANYLKTALKKPSQEQVRQLIGDLEVVLMQLANYSNETGVPLVELVKEGVDKKSILLKINLEQIRALGTRIPGHDRPAKNDQKS